MLLKEIHFHFCIREHRKNLKEKDGNVSMSTPQREPLNSDSC